MSPIQIKCYAISANCFLGDFNGAAAAVALSFGGGDVQHHAFCLHQCHPPFDVELASGFSLLLCADESSYVGSGFRRQVWNVNVSTTFRAVQNSGCRDIHWTISIVFQPEKQGAHD